MPGIANALASDLRQSLMAGFDAKIIDGPAGQALAYERRFGHHHITLNRWFGKFGQAVDGKGCQDFFNDVRFLVATTPIPTNISTYSFRGGRVLATSHHVGTFFTPYAP